MSVAGRVLPVFAGWREEQLDASATAALTCGFFYILYAV
jgi:hypothetical protein